jgi:hypothetical protein
MAKGPKTKAGKPRVTEKSTHQRLTDLASRAGDQQAG